MVSISERLRAAAKLRSKDIVIDGETYTIREVGTVPFSEYGKLVKKGENVRGTALLIAECVMDAEGNPALTDADAAEIAGSARVAMPIVTAIMQLSGFDVEKEPDAS